MIVIGVDFNTSFARSTESRTIQLKDYLLHENFKCCIEHVLSEIDYIYESKINNERSLIDHICVSENIFNAINGYTVLHHSHNLSDHSAVILSLDIDVDYVTMQNEVIDDDLNNCVDWSKATPEQINEYSDYLNNQLAGVSCPLKPYDVRLGVVIYIMRVYRITMIK